MRCQRNSNFKLNRAKTSAIFSLTAQILAISCFYQQPDAVSDTSYSQSDAPRSRIQSETVYIQSDASQFFIQGEIVCWHCAARREIAERSEAAPEAEAAQPSLNGERWKALRG